MLSSMSQTAKPEHDWLNETSTWASFYNQKAQVTILSRCPMSANPAQVDLDKLQHSGRGTFVC